MQGSTGATPPQRDNERKRRKGKKICVIGGQLVSLVMITSSSLRSSVCVCVCVNGNKGQASQKAKTREYY